MNSLPKSHQTRPILPYTRFISPVPKQTIDRSLVSVCFKLAYVIHLLFRIVLFDRIPKEFLLLIDNLKFVSKRQIIQTFTFPSKFYSPIFFFYSFALQLNRIKEMEMMFLFCKAR